MKKLCMSLGLLALFAAPFGLQSAAYADYPDDGSIATSTTITVSERSIVGGKTLTITAKARGEGDPEGTLTVGLNGKTYTNSNTPYTIKVKTAEVSSETKNAVDAAFVPDDSDGYDSSSDSTTVSLLPEGATIPGSDSSALPDTGAGNMLPFLIGGGALLLVGTGAVYAARRRRTDVA